MRWVFFFFFCIFFETNNTQLLGLSFVSRIRQAKLHLIAVSWLWNLIHACSNWILAVVFLSLIEGGDGDVMREREVQSFDSRPNFLGNSSSQQQEQKKSSRGAEQHAEQTTWVVWDVLTSFFSVFLAAAARDGWSEGWEISSTFVFVFLLP